MRNIAIVVIAIGVLLNLSAALFIGSSTGEDLFNAGTSCYLFAGLMLLLELTRQKAAETPSLAEASA